MSRLSLTVLFAIVAGAVAASLVPTVPALSDASCAQVSPTRKVCKVVEPVVNEPSYPYKNVVYSPGDTITVDAGGCVQTGGHGKTWKRYVNPYPSSDNLYYGSIWLPGATDALQRINVAHQVFSISPNASPSTTYLRVGYKDDNYSDNGYYRHDDGDNDQCKDVGNAFITLTIDHNPSATPIPKQSRPMDLVSSTSDDNGLALNPAWFYQQGGTIHSVFDECHSDLPTPSCTVQPTTVDLPGFIISHLPSFCDAEDAKGSPKVGHTNWSTGTFYGKIYFNDLSGSDDDVDTSLVGTQPMNVPLTAGNDFVMPGGTSHGVHVEFAANETIDYFKTPWWKRWDDAINNNSSGDFNNSVASLMVDGSDAVVVGLVGLDCVHDCQTEIHPAYAVAIRDPVHPAGVDRWEIFVRNRGNEGFCSQNLHYLDTTSIAIRLHGPAGATSFKAQSDLLSNDGAITTTLAPDNSDAVLIVNLPSSTDMKRLNGTIDLTWNTVANKKPAPRKSVVKPFSSASESSPESGLSAAISTLSPADRLKFRVSPPLDGHTVASPIVPGSLASFRLHHIRPTDIQRSSDEVYQFYFDRFALMCQLIPAGTLTPTGMTPQYCASILKKRAKPPARGH